MKLSVPPMSGRREDAASVEWSYFDRRDAARTHAQGRRQVNASTGTRVHTHLCLNDEPDDTRRSCVIDQAWEKQPTGWVQVT